MKKGKEEKGREENLYNSKEIAEIFNTVKRSLSPNCLYNVIPIQILVGFYMIKIIWFENSHENNNELE